MDIPCIRRLLDKGFALRYDSEYLVVRDIPYLDANKALQVGAIVAKLVFVDKVRVQQQDHQVFFAGSVPHGLDGKPVPNLGGGAASLTLAKPDVIVERSFSNKPSSGGFPDFFAKIEHYLNLIGGPAMSLHGFNPYTFRVDHDVVGDSVFKFRDTLTSRAEIGDLAALLKSEVIAIIGLGGTGCYILDFMVKTPVKEIRGFDGDFYFVHNAYRSPGHLDEQDLGQAKAAVYARRYDNFRHNLKLERKYIDGSSAADLEGVTFAFVCVDKGSARAEIFDLLIKLGIPFIDVGMGLNRKEGPLAGALRATYFPADKAAAVRDMQLAELADHPDDVYRAQVQISELNAMNACLAVMRYKQLRGFYLNKQASIHMLFDTAGLKLFGQEGP
ncbi:ThiF family adenylyltransferase [Bradyrhizobium sp. 24]|nr:ThiF family adenylyltransferase [Bradyrhizobium sp. 37]MCK1378566.1 ThiF family adenylyltransferase [Bradyrhizobium sp. 24]MCK1773455.1 ThiF family adenylyltransferase [Bradyrhizobium sp. 134]